MMAKIRHHQQTIQNQFRHRHHLQAIENKRNAQFVLGLFTTYLYKYSNHMYHYVTSTFFK